MLESDDGGGDYDVSDDDDDDVFKDLLWNSPGLLMFNQVKSLIKLCNLAKTS